MENIYLVNGPEIIKLNSDGNILNRYSNNVLGEISSIDVNNPLQILVFYRDQSQIVFLDNTLSEQKSGISTLQISDAYITLACNSNIGGFWVYNASTLELQKRDKSSGVSSTSNNLSLVVGQNVDPLYLKEYNNVLQVLSDSVLYLFDNQVNLIKKLHLKESTFLNFHKKILTTLESNTLRILNTETYLSTEYYLPQSTKRSTIYSTHEYIYFIKGKTLSVYPLKK